MKMAGDDGKTDGNIKTKYRIIISVLAAAVLVFLFVLAWNYISAAMDREAAPNTCGDGSFYDTCNIDKPYYCDAGTGKLVERASICGCPAGTYKSGDSCISPYQTGARNITLEYILRGEEKSMGMTVYYGLASHMANLPRKINYQNGEKPQRADFSLMSIGNEEQRQLMIPLLMEIYNSAGNREDQLRIAVSLVQNIPFGESAKTLNFAGGNSITYSRYPYEVLYDGEGICSEKSDLLAFLLKEMGYGTAYFYYQEENHEAIGVKCPLRYSLDNTGYCFIETTGPSIITDSGIEYEGGARLTSTPETAIVSKGEAMGSDMYEYGDAKKMMKLRDNSIILFRNIRLNRLKDKYGLIETYKIR
jgi:hypothetical protein